MTYKICLVSTALLKHFSPFQNKFSTVIFLCNLGTSNLLPRLYELEFGIALFRLFY